MSYAASPETLLVEMVKQLMAGRDAIHAESSVEDEVNDVNE